MIAVLFARKDSVYKTMANCDDEERAKVAAYKAAWRVKNAERLKAKDAAYRAANRERLIAQQAKWYAENKERAHESQRKWNPKDDCYENCRPIRSCRLDLQTDGRRGLLRHRTRCTDMATWLVELAGRCSAPLSIAQGAMP